MKARWLHLAAVRSGNRLGSLDLPLQRLTSPLAGAMLPWRRSQALAQCRPPVLGLPVLATLVATPALGRDWG